MKKSILICLCAVLIFLLTSCRPTPPTPTIERPTRPDEADRITTIAPDAPYLPAGGVPTSDWPTRPITIIVPFLPGGDTNLYARMFAPRLAEELGQPVYIMNIDGGSGTFGANAVRTTAPDGYTILFYHTGNLFTNILTGETELNYGDFEIACIAMHCYANVLVVHRDMGISTAEEFLAYIRANPSSLRVATTITGFSFKLLRLAEIAGDFQTTPVHVGGGSMMAPSILAGHTEMGYNNLAIFMEYIESGEMLPLWVAAAERNIHLPDVPLPYLREVTSDPILIASDSYNVTEQARGINT
jgi:tripartite-type tricarboxylate transporter receptor subunit TctC